ncbi:MAG: hypothetical protein K8F24_04190, partial [Bacteroidales bacterium]|nr:hypothetical protein [Bacteroidales bacterium]
INGYQYTDIEDLYFFIEKTASKWGKSFDALAVQNQGRLDEYKNLLQIFDKKGFSFGEKFNVNHHLSHAALAFYTSPFSNSLILSYDGTGNDGYTIFFDANSEKGISYLENLDFKFGQSYNNLGYIVGIKPEVCGTSSGKTMGLTAYGKVIENWLPYAAKYVKEYKKNPLKSIEGLNNYGKGHRINSIGLDEIPDLQEFVSETEAIEQTGIKNKLLSLLKDNSIPKELRLNGLDTQVVQDLIKTVQSAWTSEVLSLIAKHKPNYENLCLVGGCALNGITNYSIQETNWFKGIHLVPNPSDCGLSVGAGLFVYYNLTKKKFEGYGQYFSPYLGEEIFDKEDLPKLKEEY